MVVEFSAASREALEAYLKAENMHYDWVLRDRVGDAGAGRETARRGV